MKDKALATSMFNDFVRAEIILNLGSMLHSSDNLPDALEDALETDAEDILATLGIEIDDDEEDIDDVRELLLNSGEHGWLILFATPVPKFQEDGTPSFSWGPYVNTSWFYGEDFDALCNRALNWKYELLAERREKWEKSNQG